MTVRSPVLENKSATYMDCLTHQGAHLTIRKLERAMIERWIYKHSECYFT